MAARQPGAGFRLAAGGRIDRSRPLTFRWNGHAMPGFAGDTIASALLANGVRIVGRGMKFHRPRGILSAGIEEPNALVTLGAGASIEPNTRATMIPARDGLEVRAQNCWPSVEFDLGPPVRRDGAALAGRLLQQDLHLAVLALLRAVHPPGRRPRTRADAARPVALRSRQCALRPARRRRRARGTSRRRQRRARRPERDPRRTGFRIRRAAPWFHGPDRRPARDGMGRAHRRGTGGLAAGAGC